MFRFILLGTVILLAGSALAVRADEKVAAQTSPAGQAAQLPGVGKIVGLDYFYNHQIRDGKQVRYTWENTDADGYSKFGDIWKSSGATLAKLEKAPTRQDLNQFSIYIIASPTNERDAPGHHPNYLDPDAIGAIVSWVQDGGVLLLFGNSKDNCELKHLNELAQQFGIKFNGDVSSTLPKPGDTSVVYDGKQVPAFPETIRLTGFPIGLHPFPDHVLFRGVTAINIPEFATLSVAARQKNSCLNNTTGPLKMPLGLVRHSM